MFTRFDKAIAAWLTAAGISIPWAEVAQQIDWNSTLAVLFSQGWKAAAYAVVAGLAVYFWPNKGTVYTGGGAR